MDVAEHFYTDDPRRGPQDGRTDFPGAEYFFLGNGLIQAAVQVTSGQAGTPVGLLIMDPERLGQKSRALSFDPVFGLRSTQVEVSAAGRVRLPSRGGVRGKWAQAGAVPAVEIRWQNSLFSVIEVFFCPDREEPRLCRSVTIKNRREEGTVFNIRTGIREHGVCRRFELPRKGERTFYLEYRLCGKRGDRRVEIGWSRRPRFSGTAKRYWRRASRFHGSASLLDHFYSASLVQLPAVIAASGKLDGSIWQYNREWTRDLSMAAIGLTLGGQFELARTVLDRLLTRFVSATGDTLDSSERRPPGECELDQNGSLLVSLEKYLLWSGDGSLLKKHWRKVRAAAEFPLRSTFRHPASGLLHNGREFWERHSIHGIEDGLELAHQVWVSMGLDAASRLAVLVDRKAQGRRWQREAVRLKKATLSDMSYALIDNGVFIKRRNSSGEVQEEIHPRAASGLPDGVPLFSPGRHLLNPDTSAALPLAWEFIPPRCRIADRTLQQLETLWNQSWKGGGYGRYHVSSEPDSPGPWPFPSLFVARACLEAGRDERVWRILRWLAGVQGGGPGAWFEFYGRRPVPPYPQVGVVPWTWTEILLLTVHHLAGVRPESSFFRVRPRLLAGMSGHRCDIRLRKHRVFVETRRAGRGERPGFIVEGRRHPYSEEGLLLPYPRKNVRIRARLPRRARRKAG